MKLFTISAAARGAMANALEPNPCEKAITRVLFEMDLHQLRRHGWGISNALP
jgi:hypothetical protein